MSVKIGNIERYHGGLVLIHWVMALAILGLLISGLIMTGGILEPSAQYKLFQAHKAFGVLMLLALSVRIIVRLLTFVPPLPFPQPKWEAIGTHIGHFMLYILMASMVVSGWLMVSSSPFGLPTSVFGWFDWPHIPGIPQDEGLSQLAKAIHELSAYALIVVILAHLAGVVKHYILDKANIIPRMWWVSNTANWLGGFVLSAGLIIAVLTLFSGRVSDASNKSEIASINEKEPQTSLVTTAATSSVGASSIFAVDYAQSTITFGATHAGDPFTGQFTDWSAEIDFDPEKLDSSTISARIQLASARTGDSQYDGTLPGVDWFHVEAFQEARFVSTDISAIGGDRYRVDGALTLKGITKHISFDMTLTDLSASPVTATANLSLARLDFKIGTGTDPDGEWVSKEVSIMLSIVADRNDAK